MKKKLLLIVLVSTYCTVITQSQAFKLGIENITKRDCKLLKAGLVGLITNQTGLSQNGMASVNILRDIGVQVACLFAPEHGIGGIVAAGKDVVSDTQATMPCFSLYGAGAQERFANAMQDLHAVCYDIQDCGMRYFTYISTLFRTMEYMRKSNKKFIVFDRPNPLGGAMEGPLVDDELRSFISIAPIPLRHGMTVGELAKYFNTEFFGNEVDLHVVRMKNYRRNEPVLLPTFLSPNVQTVNACKGYSFLGLLGEVRPFDVCVGSECAFQCIMLPKSIKVSDDFWHILRDNLADYGVHSELFERFSHRKKKSMVGLKIVHHTGKQHNAFPAFLTTIHALHGQGVPVTFSPSFDKAAGAAWVRNDLVKKVAVKKIVEKARKHAQLFHAKAKSIFLYKPFPQVV